MRFRVLLGAALVAGLTSALAAHDLFLKLADFRVAANGRATAYLCEGFVCQAPTSDPAELGRQLDGAVNPSASRPAAP